MSTSDSLTTRSQADLSSEKIEAKAREAGTLAYMWRCAAADSFKRGWVLESEGRTSQRKRPTQSTD